MLVLVQVQVPEPALVLEQEQAQSRSQVRGRCHDRMYQHAPIRHRKPHTAGARRHRPLLRGRYSTIVA